MRPPSAKILFLGNPVSVLSSMGLAAYLCWLCYQNANAGTILLAFAGLWLIDRSIAASEVCRRYRAWQRDWSAAGGITTKSRVPPLLRKVVGICFLIGESVWLANQSDPAGRWLAVGPGLAVLLLALGPLLKRLRRGLRRKAVEYRGPVLVVVPGPLQAIPSLKDAYRLVPDYCQQVIQGRS